MSDEIVLVRFHKRYQIWNPGEVAGFPPHIAVTLIPEVAVLNDAKVPAPEAPAPEVKKVEQGSPTPAPVTGLASVLKQG